MNDLAAKILAAIEQLENDCREAGRYGAPDQLHRQACELNSFDAGPCDCDGPALVLRRCAADRKIVELHSDTGFGHCQSCAESGPHAAGDSGNAEFPCGTLLALADGYGITQEES